VLHVIDEVLSPANASAQPATSLATVVPFTSGIQPETSVYSELTQTTSYVAAGLVTATPSVTKSATGNSSATTTTASAPARQTVNAGGRNELPVLAVAAVGAVAFAVGLW